MSHISKLQTYAESFYIQRTSILFSVIMALLRDPRSQTLSYNRVPLCKWIPRCAACNIAGMVFQFSLLWLSEIVMK